MSGIVKFFHVYVHCSVKDRLVVPGAELKLVSLAWPGCLSPQIQVACDLPQIPLLEYERCGDGTLVQVTVLEPYKTVNRPKEEDKGSRPTLNHPVCSGQKPGKVKASIQQAAVARPTAVVVPSQCNGTGADANSTRFNETDTNSDEEQEESDEENSKDGLQQPEPHRCSSTWKPTARSRRNRGSPSSEAEVVSPVRGKVHVSQVLRQTQKDYKVKKKAMRQRHKLRVDELKSKVKRLTWLLRESGTDGAQFDKMITRMDPGSDAAQACKAVKTRDRRQQKKAVEQSTGSSTLTKKKAKGAARG
ncbi:uncharacterized protein HMPREF1541_10802 [Cyphellophora europaea CBS 101466]|uniref:Uncharacterized protein n=1 Tax=Cyphellophora europaea (strain CBS 101466) TaxID=1220924 RepID=W2S6B9_CYPE1|nr:uncharacterized protein HMPREF1541_10802 [Cyphellophora europaea CBS 101466]ETN44251.1 hypothetical protein HMPREF1541_10802 [Cyphellophora europaea CBS 101466]